MAKLSSINKNNKRINLSNKFYNKREKLKKISNKAQTIKVTEDSGQRKRYLKSKEEGKVALPKVPNKIRKQWRREREALTKFFNELDYNNQIQSSYDLTLLGDNAENFLKSDFNFLD